MFNRHIFDIWSLQEVMNSLPEITLHWYSKREGVFKEVNKKTYNKKWDYLIGGRKTPKKALRNIIPQGFQFKSKEDSIFFARNYLGVIKQDNFLTILKEILNVSSINTEKIRTFNPIYMLSFLSNPEGTCIYGTVDLRDPSEMLYKNKRPTETRKTGEVDTSKIKSYTVSIHPLWLYLTKIISGQSFPSLHEVFEEISQLQEEFVNRFTCQERYYFNDWVVDTSFLMRYAEFPYNPLVVFRNSILSSTLGSIKIHISTGVFKEIEGHKKGKNLEKKQRAVSVSRILKEFRENYPNDFIEHTLLEDDPEIQKLTKIYSFSKVDAHSVLIVKKLQEEGQSPLLLTTDYDIMNVAASFKIPVANRCPPAELSLTSKSVNKIYQKTVDDILEWFFEAASLDPLKPYLKGKIVPSVCDILVKSKRDFPKFLEELTNTTPSFFIEGIERVREGYFSEKLPPLLKDYLFGNKDKKLLKSKDTLLFLLDPERLPKASWPSGEGIHPFFNQYLAITAADHHFIQNEEEKIIAVNGPPGTGKTTLLKEIVANTVVKMASVVADVKKSGKGLVHKRRSTTHTKESPVIWYCGFKPFKDLGIVVASANNNAVQNVAKELPLQDNNALNENNPLVKEVILDDPATFALWTRFKELADACFKRIFPQEKKNIKCFLNISAVLGKKSFANPFLKTAYKEIKRIKSDSKEGGPLYNLETVKEEKLRLASRP